MRTALVPGIALAATVLAMRWLAGRARGPAPVAEVWQSVAGTWMLRWLSAALSEAMLFAGCVLVDAAAGDPRLAAACGLVVMLTVWVAMIVWRDGVMYRGDVLIAKSAWHRRRDVRLSELRVTGHVGPLGDRYTTGNVGTVQGNFYRSGGPALIARIADPTACDRKAQCRLSASACTGSQ